MGWGGGGIALILTCNIDSFVVSLLVCCKTKSPLFNPPVCLILMFVAHSHTEY